MYAVIKPLLFAMSPTAAHRVAMAGLAPLEHLAPLRSLVRPPRFDPRLAVRKMGLVFPTPIGLAAGLDKNGTRARAFAALGFGHVELGTVTAEVQGPNPPPNLFRLPLDRALVNRLGFPNEGAGAVARRVEGRVDGVGVPVGLSIGKSRSVDTSHAVADYVASFRAVRKAADFVVVNVSSPNTKDLRALQAEDAAREIFGALMEENSRGPSRPILVKIAPDLTGEAIDAVVDEAVAAGLAGVVATNTTISRNGLVTPKARVDEIGAGGLSGRPIRTRSLEVVKRVRARLGDGPCVIGVGGIDDTESALAMLRAGADLVQIYTGFVYEGPSLPRVLARGLAAAMDKEGASTLDALVRGRSRTSGAHGANGSAAVAGS
jgi:dihydroorotate dehydrogenase